MRERTRRELLRLAAAAGAGSLLAGPLAREAFAAETAEYDDGTDAVPGGLAGDPERVIIVGAGWAGLTLANALRNAGVEYVLLEGRSRIGGRAHTVDLAGVPIDLGCSWIHEPVDNPMTRFAEQAGVARRNADIELDVATIRAYDAFADRDATLPEKLAAFGHARELRRQRGVGDLRRAGAGGVGPRRRAGLPRPPGPRRATPAATPSSSST